MKLLSDYERLTLKGIVGNNRRARLRHAHGADNAFTKPTLAHVPGVEPEGRYSTIPFRYAYRKTVDKPLKTKSRILPERLAAPRVVHLGRGKTLTY
jgi:hypothetical protein